jgi:hypothetical protein
MIALVLGFLTPLVSSARASNDLPSIDQSIPSTNIEPVNVEAAVIQSKPSLLKFINVVKNSVSDDLVGVYVQNVLAFRIVDQPGGNYAYVSEQQDAVTLFGMAMKYDSIGLLAHNNLAGKEFNKLLINTRINLIYGNGAIRTFTVTDVKYYHASNPYSPYSNFEDVENLGTWLTAKQVFNQIYGVNDRLIFQTCIEADGNPAWGRLFVTAEEINSISVGSPATKIGTGLSVQ